MANAPTELSSALSTLKSSTSPQEFLTAVKTMHTYCKNIVEKPTGAADKHTDSCFIYALTQSSRTARRRDADDTRLHVAEEKYRKVRVENEAFKRRLGSHAGGLDAMR